MSWNFRVVHFDGEENCLGICEVFYDEEELVKGWTGPVKLCVPAVEGLEGLKWDLEKMREALEKPILKESQLNES